MQIILSLLYMLRAWMDKKSFQHDLNPQRERFIKLLKEIKK